MTRAEQRQEWERLIADYRASGLTAKKWCAAHHVQFHQLKYRLRHIKIDPGTQPTRWLPVEMAPVEHDDNLLIRIGAASIEVRSGFDPALLQDVVRALASC